jgi:hypothetical protein
MLKNFSLAIHRYQMLLITGIALVGVLSWVAPAAASDIYLSFTPQLVSVGNQFEADLMLSSGGKTINAIDFTVQYDPSMVKLVGIEDTKSLSILWATPPTDDHGTIHGSGIIPGGWSSVLVPVQEKSYTAPVVSFIFQAQGQGQETITVSDAHVLLNDGKGTEDSVGLGSSSIVIGKAQTGLHVAIAKETVPPQALTAELVNDPAINGGRPSLVFEASNGSSPLRGYEVKEGNSSWAPADNPYLIAHPDLQESISIKAIDEDGNSSVITIAYYPQEGISNTARWGIIDYIKIIGAILAALALVMFLVSYVWRKSTHRNQ